MYKYMTVILLLPLFLNSSVLAEILIINVESASNNGLALIGIYDKEENFGKAKVNKKLNTEKILTPEELLKELKEIPINCKNVTFKIFGLSLATINIVISLILSSITMNLFLNYEKNK